jgi:hypothetical protein
MANSRLDEEEDQPTSRRDRRADDQKTGLERHIQSIILTIATGTIFFCATFVYNTKSEVAVIQVQIQQVTTQLIEIRSDLKAMQSLYVTKDDFRVLEQKFYEHTLHERNGMAKP